MTIVYFLFAKRPALVHEPVDYKIFTIFNVDVCKLLDYEFSMYHPAFLPHLCFSNEMRLKYSIYNIILFHEITFSDACDLNQILLK